MRDFIYHSGGARKVPPKVVFSILSIIFICHLYYFYVERVTSWVVSPIRKLYFLSNIELRSKNQKQPLTTISVPMIYIGMTSKIKLKVLISTPMLELQYEY
jgi:hypothetical protein